MRQMRRRSLRAWCQVVLMRRRGFEEEEAKKAERCKGKEQTAPMATRPHTFSRFLPPKLGRKAATGQAGEGFWGFSGACRQAPFVAETAEPAQNTEGTQAAHHLQETPISAKGETASCHGTAAGEPSPEKGKERAALQETVAYLTSTILYSVLCILRTTE